MIVCNQCLSPLTLGVPIPLRRCVLDTTLCVKVCQWLAAWLWFSPGTTVSSTNKTDRNDTTEILLKVALKIIIIHPSRYTLHRIYLTDLKTMTYSIGGDIMVQGSWNLVRKSKVFNTGRHLEYWLYICWDGNKETIVPWRFRNWPAFQNIQVHISPCQNIQVHISPCQNIQVPISPYQNIQVHVHISPYQNIQVPISPY